MDTDEPIDTIDTANPDPPPELLQERAFIQENFKKTPRPFWTILAIFVALIVLFWGVGSWYYQTMEERFEGKPFLQVTNREMSLFLWQFPEYMPQHVAEKTGYLPGFDYREKLGVTLESADDYVQAPPDLLFLYHTWARLLREYYFSRPILRGEFMEFLKLQPEWAPKHWKNAPSEYGKMVEGINSLQDDNLESLSSDAFPIIVRQAFQGWKNYRYEGDSINAFTIKYSELQAFLKVYGHYNRNYWRNILNASYPRYLWTYSFEKFDDSEEVPKNELAPFLRFALFNAFQTDSSITR